MRLTVGLGRGPGVRTQMPRVWENRRSNGPSSLALEGVGSVLIDIKITRF